MNLGDIDLNKPGERLEPFSLDLAQRRSLQKGLVDVVLAAGGRPEEIFSKHQAEPLVWYVPPSYVPPLMGTVPVTVSLYKAKDSLLDIVKDYTSDVRRLAKTGWTEVTKKHILRKFESLSCDRLFTQQASGNPSQDAALYAAEFALLLQGRADRTVADGDNFAVAVRQTFGRAWLGISEGKILVGKTGIPVPDMSVLRMHLTAYRGTVVADTFDVFDRYRLWMEDAWANLDPDWFDAANAALSYLKLARDPGIAYSMEQMLWKAQYSTEADRTLRELMYTGDALDEIRRQWEDPGVEFHIKFKDTYDTLVPTYLDAEHFERMFGVIPHNVERLSAGMRRKAASGMESFIKMFLLVQRNYEARRA